MFYGLSFGIMVSLAAVITSFHLKLRSTYKHTLLHMHRSSLVSAGMSLCVRVWTRDVHNPRMCMFVHFIFYSTCIPYTFLCILRVENVRVCFSQTVARKPHLAVIRCPWRYSYRDRKLEILLLTLRGSTALFHGR